MDLTKLTKAQLIALIAAAGVADTPRASQHRSISQLRAAGTFSCGVTGHGKADDGNFATRNGATFHAKTCTAMAKALKAS